MRRGFTLIEMVVVLGVLALATHFALRELSRHRDARMERAADRQLEMLRDASVEFIADMGRMVCATNGTLSELWERPAGALPFAIRPAVESNLVAGASPALVDAKVFVPTGWKGPYVRLPLGKTRLFDPWGNAVETIDAGGLPRIGLTNETYAVEVSHYGAGAGVRGRRTLSLLPERGAEAVLRVKAVSVNGGTLPDSVTYRWYGPAGGAITGAVETVARGEYAVFRGLTPGRRMLHDSASGTVREVEIGPGDANLVEIKLP